MASKTSIGFILFTVFLLFTPSAKAEFNHTLQGGCQTCHLTDPSDGPLIFVGNLDSICQSCHTLAREFNHPSQVKTTLSLPGDFWRDDENRVNCATCHDPHPEEHGTYPFLLRRNAANRDFCLLCHTGPITSEGSHVGVTLLAHNKNYTPSQSGATLDQASRDCITCHDGSGEGKHAPFCLLLSDQDHSCTAHIIGLDYDEAVRKNKELRPRSGLDPVISFYEGKIGCLSCHNIYSSRPDMLSYSMSQSALCMACHFKM